LLNGRVPGQRTKNLTQKVLSAEECHFETPWVDIYVGREYSDRPLMIDLTQSGIGKKRKADHRQPASIKKRNGKHVIEHDTPIRKGDAYLNILFQVSVNTFYF